MAWKKDITRSDASFRYITMNHREDITLRDRIIKAIQSGQVTMRPRWHFILKTILVATGVMVVFLGLLYIISFIIFILQHTGLLFVPLFGMGGIYRLLFSLPWVLIFLSFSFLVVLEILVRRHAFAYRRPLLYSIMGILTIVIIGGIVVAQTSFHSRLLRHAREDRLPFAGGFYRSFAGGRLENVVRGHIIGKTKDGFFIEDMDNNEIFVTITPHTRFPFGMDFNGGDIVVVFGDRKGSSTVSAFGIKRVGDDADPEAQRWSSRQRGGRGYRMK
ncbi:MAG: hypothetical protein HZA36_01410 [Parcubacteria group bacterium]|nr:hypothetical protein [Parcubacteria group bacterium]